MISSYFRKIKAYDTIIIFIVPTSQVRDCEIFKNKLSRYGDRCLPYLTVEMDLLLLPIQLTLLAQTTTVLKVGTSFLSKLTTTMSFGDLL